MREKSDASKLKEGRGEILPDGNSYEAWKTAREAKSTGTACAVYDPRQKRTVNLLSQGEAKVFWVLCMFPDVVRILDQKSMDKEVVTTVCKDLGYRPYSTILSTDFLCEKRDGSWTAVSVKSNRKQFYAKDSGLERRIRRENVGKAYWERFGVKYLLIFSDEISDKLAGNIRDVMSYYDAKWVCDPATMLMHMVAHHAIRVPMMGERVKYKLLASKINVEELYGTYKERKDDADFRGWDLDLSGRVSLPSVKQGKKESRKRGR